MNHLFFRIQASFILLVACFSMGNMAIAGDYEDRASLHYTGTWEGEFEHLTPLPNFKVTVKIEDLNLRNPLSDDNPTGTVTFSTAEKFEQFTIKRISVFGGYLGVRPTPEMGEFFIAFENDLKMGTIKFPMGLFKSRYSKIELGIREAAMAFGSLSKL